ASARGRTARRRQGALAYTPRSCRGRRGRHQPWAAPAGPQDYPAPEGRPQQVSGETVRKAKSAKLMRHARGVGILSLRESVEAVLQKLVATKRVGQHIAQGSAQKRTIANWPSASRKTSARVAITLRVMSPR